jgi:hypothetical protein
MPERNFTQDSSVPRIADPMTAPMISWAIVPTTISESAVEIRSQIEIKLAISARPSHNAASAQTPVMKSSLRTGARVAWTHARNKNPPSGGSQTDSYRMTFAVGVISQCGGYGGLHPLYQCLGNLCVRSRSVNVS